METWFIFAVLSAVLGGIGAFCNKVTAQRNYSATLVMTINAITSFLLFTSLALWFENAPSLSSLFIFITFLSGVLASFSLVIKIEALHYIDSTIFLPLFKVFGPLIVVILSILFFSESFSTIEWFGIIMSLLVPVLLVSRVENSRQNNLALGIILVLACAALSAITIGLQKFAVDIAGSPLWIMSISAIGILIGSVVQHSLKHRGAILKSITHNFSWGIFQLGLLRTIFAGGGFLCVLYALNYGGPLGIVFTINSLYILPPIILAIIFYNEHWNLRKAFAIALSVLALALLQ